MVFGMVASKIAITLNNDQVAAVRELVAAGRASSVSGFVQHAVGIALFDAAGWRAMLDDALSQTGGAVTRREQMWADRLLRPTGRKPGTARSRPAGNEAA